MSIQAIVRTINTVSMTFTGKPSAEVLQRLKTAGFKYDKGNWYSTQADSKLVDEDGVVSHIAA